MKVTKGVRVGTDYGSGVVVAVTKKWVVVDVGGGEEVAVSFGDEPVWALPTEYEESGGDESVDLATSIIDDIPALVDRVVGDCKAGGDPSIYRRGDKWRYHFVRAGTSWADGDTPLEAANSVKRSGKDGQQ